MHDEEQIPPPEPIPEPESAPESAPDEAPPTLFLAPAAPELPAPRGIAPLWHTILLIAAIFAYSFWGAQRADSALDNPLAPVHSAVTDSHGKAGATASPAKDEGADRLRLLRYGLSGGLELLVVVWVLFGLRLRKVPFRSLFGAWPRGLNDITKEAGIAAAFWLCSMVVLAAFALSWNVVQTRYYDYQLKKEQPSAASSSTPGSKSSTPADKPRSATRSPQQEQADMAKELMQLAPANGLEIAAWGLLCLIVGFSEELIFRGYLQSQGIRLLGSIPISIVLTSLVFGAAHGYQGIRGVCLIGIYGALFSILTRIRRNLFPGMLAHAWHDFATGIALALIRESHLLDRLPLSS